jgi:hypothetical protein
MLTIDFGVVVGHYIFRPANQGEEDNWDMVCGATERSLSPAPTVKETVPEVAQQTSVTTESRASAEESKPEPSATTRTRELVVAHTEEEAPAKAGLVDIASILGALIVTIVRSSL